MFKFVNPHPKHLRTKDCVKRACCLGSGINYHDVAIMLNRFKKETGGKKYNSNENWRLFIEKVLLGQKLSGDMRYAYNGHRYQVSNFAKLHSGDVAILRCSGHLVATMNGYYYDTGDSGEKSVYIAFIMPAYEIIVNHVRSEYPWLCKGLTLEKRN